jgi:hypothetical protein
MTSAPDTATRYARSAFVGLALAALTLAPLVGGAAEPKPKPKPAAKAQERTCDGDGPMWMSIGHPGLGEMKNSGEGWKGVPKRKFWLGFIPFYGWPGYLQVVSAIDAKHCRTNDWPN